MFERIDGGHVAESLAVLQVLGEQVAHLRVGARELTRSLRRQTMKKS